MFSLPADGTSALPFWCKGDARVEPEEIFVLTGGEGCDWVWRSSTLHLVLGFLGWAWYYGWGQLADKLESDLMAKSLERSRERVNSQDLGEADHETLLSQLRFCYPLRKYQQEIIELVRLKIERNEKELHIVAPPGAGKTIMGLQIVTELKRPALILTPNTTIQSQWAQKLQLFLPPELEGFGTSEFVGAHEHRPLRPITVMTYQVLSTPGREQEYMEQMAHRFWVEELAATMTRSDAELRIVELLQNNPAAHRKEKSRHMSRVRRKLTEILDLKEVLHGNALELLQLLRRQKFGVVLFDECHHLTDYWAAVMAHLVKTLEDPIVVGLTGTPPEGKSARQENRYLSLVGEIDYQVPTCALVKEGGLAPFQDLVYFVEPTETEMHFLESQHEEFHALLEELVQPVGDEPSRLTSYVLKVIAKASETGLSKFYAEEPEMLSALCRYLWKMQLKLPIQVEMNEAIMQSPVIDDWMLLLEEFALHGLKTSASKEDHRLYDRICAAMRKLGYGLTEQGLRKQASPVDRVLAFSKSKAQAVGKILDVEYMSLQNRLRAAVVTDFEKMSATSVRNLKGVLDTESGGAMAVLRELLALPISEKINPCLVTGSHLVIDRRIKDLFVAAAEKYLRQRGHHFELEVIDYEGAGFVELSGAGAAWETKLYVGLATELFERGISQCLIGTRGIFGEGWDSQALNTLIDLTTTTSPVAVKQLRGRAIRIDTQDPLGGRKVANNWDVVCIAPQLEKGLNDYHRFVRKHDGYFGICDDGQIECGVGHVHPAFSDLTPCDVFASAQDFNIEMINRALVRDQIYNLWKVGEKYNNREIGCVELSRLRCLNLTPPHIRKDVSYRAHVRHLRAALNGVWWEYCGLSGMAACLLSYFLHGAGMALYPAALPVLLALFLARKKYISLYGRLRKEICQPNTQESSLYDMAIAVFSALQNAKQLPKHLSRDSLKVTVRSNGSYRVFLDDAEPSHAQVFTRCFQEVMAPVTNQPYLIPKYEYSFPRERGKDDSEGAFFKMYLRGRAEPRIAAYHAVPKLLARSEKGRGLFEAAWNKYVSPGFVVCTEEKPELLERYFGIGPSLAQRLLWE